MCVPLRRCIYAVCSRGPHASVGGRPSLGAAPSAERRRGLVDILFKKLLLSDECARARLVITERHLDPGQGDLRGRGRNRPICRMSASSLRQMSGVHAQGGLQSSSNVSSPPAVMPPLFRECERSCRNRPCWNLWLPLSWSALRGPKSSSLVAVLSSRLGELPPPPPCCRAALVAVLSRRLGRAVLSRRLGEMKRNVYTENGPDAGARTHGARHPAAVQVLGGGDFDARPLVCDCGAAHAAMVDVIFLCSA